MRRTTFILVLLSLLLAVPVFAVLPDRDEPVRTVILIRHGEYEHDEDCDEDVGCGLVVLGRQQTRLTGDRLKAMPIAFTSIQASAMTRARQTGEIIAERFPGLDLVLERDIRECTPSTRVLEVDPLAWLGMSVANCSLTVVQVRTDGSKKLIAFADSGHIPYSMTTYPGVEAAQ